MRRQWRLKDAMQFIAILAIYFAAGRSLSGGPSDDLRTMWMQMSSVVILFLVLPLHVLSAWGRLR